MVRTGSERGRRERGHITRRVLPLRQRGEQERDESGRSLARGVRSRIRARWINWALFITRASASRQNDREAFRLYNEAAKLNYLASTGNLGVLYLASDETDLGKNLTARRQKAVSLFRDGARQENAYCMYLYARCFELGEGVETNPAEASNWYRRAAQAGNPQAQDWCRQHNISFETGEDR